MYEVWESNIKLVAGEKGSKAAPQGTHFDESGQKSNVDRNPCDCKTTPLHVIKYINSRRHFHT